MTKGQSAEASAIDSMLQISAMALMTAALMEAEPHHTAHSQQQQTGFNRETMCYSNVKREFETSLNFELHYSFGPFVSDITLSALCE